MPILSKKSVGIDIADRSIEVVEVVETRGKVRISSTGRFVLPAGIVERGRIINKQKLANALRQTLSYSRPHPIEPETTVFGLPESQVFVHTFELGPHNPMDREKLVLSEAHSSIPISEEDLLYSYAVINETKQKSDIVLVGVSKEVYDEWRNFFDELNIKVTYFDVETLAILRGLFVERPEAPTCVVDFGAGNTSVFIYSKEGLRYTYNIDVAGEKLTEFIAETLQISKHEAEDNKVKLGLSDKDSPTYSALIAGLQPVMEGIKASLAYFKHKTGEEVTSMVLVGGSSKLKGFLNHVKNEIGIPTWLGESVLMRSSSSLEYIEAVGLALRGLNRDKDKIDPVISYTKSKSITQHKGQDIESHKPGLNEKEDVGEIELVSPIELNREKKDRKEKLILLSVIIVGLIVIFLAGWYRDFQREKRQEELLSRIIEYTHVQKYSLAVEVATNPDDYAAGLVTGRIINDTVVTGTNFSENLAESRRRAQNLLGKDEAIWPEPVDTVAAQAEEESTEEDTADEDTTSSEDDADTEDTIETSIEDVLLVDEDEVLVKWLVYSVKEANTLLVKQVTEGFGARRDFALTEISITGIKTGNVSDKFVLTGDVVISSSEIIDVSINSNEAELLEEINVVEEEDTPDEGENTEDSENTEDETTETTEETADDVDTVTILETGIGYLNVRSGAGTGFAVVTTVTPGDTYPLLEEDGEWYQIQLEDETEGWIFSDFAEKN